MKVKNLYIGDIYIVTVIKRYFGFVTDLDGKLKRTTIFYKTDDKDKYLRDIIYGGKYHSELPINAKVGTDVVPPKTLNQEIILRHLASEGYSKKNISKRKLIKILEKSI